MVAVIIGKILMEPAKIRAMSAGVWVIDALLASQECRALVRCASLAGFEDAHQRFAGRHNAEAFVENTDLATRLEAELLSCGFHVDLDDLLEIYRYQDGEHITSHADRGRTIRRQHQSNSALLIYLSDDFEGGRTIFTGRGTAVRPSVGRAVLFEHGIVHAAEAVSEGVKYVARIDAHLNPVRRSAGAHRRTISR